MTFKSTHTGNDIDQAVSKVKNKEVIVVYGNIEGDITDQEDLSNALVAKQDVISDLATIRSGASAGATAVQNTDLNSAINTHDTNSEAHATLLAGKQDVIQDIATIRSGASAGATAVQPSAMETAISTHNSSSEAHSTLFAGKQETLVSGENIKTINNQSILGSGNINIEGGGGSSLPDQTGHAGEFLNTDGTDASWAALNFNKGFTTSLGESLPTLSANGTMGGSTNACACGTQQYDPYLAFNGDTSNYWGPSSSSVPQWITYYSATPVSLGKVTYIFPDISEAYAAGYLEASTDNSTWTQIGSFSGNAELQVSVVIVSTEKFKYFRTTFTEHAGSGGYGKANIVLYEKGDIHEDINVSVDDKTTYINGNGQVSAAVPNAGAGLKTSYINTYSATAISTNGTMGGGTCAASSNQDSENAYKAFDSSASTGWGLPSSYITTNPVYLTYYTSEPSVLASITYSYVSTSTESMSTYKATVLGSNDNEVWTKIGSFSGGNPSTTFTSTVALPFKYFRTTFTNINQYADTESMNVAIKFGTPALAANVDGNSVKVGSDGRLYAPQVLQDIEAPLSYNVLSVGGTHNYNVSSGYLVPTYTSNLSFYYYSGQEYVSVMNSNVSAPTTVAEAFSGNVSYIDIPCNVDKLVADVEAGRRSEVSCLFSSLLSEGSSASQSIAWIAGNTDGTTFTPYLFASVSDMGGGVTFLTGGYTVGGEYENGLTVESTATTQGSTALNDGSGFAITYTGSAWQVACSSKDPYYGMTMEYHTTTVTASQLEKLGKINVVRFVNMYGQSTAANNPTVAGFGYNNSTWTPADGAQDFYTLTVNCDNETVSVNSQGQLTAAGGGGASRCIGEIISSTLPIADASLHLLDGSLLSGSGIYSGFVDYIKNLYNEKSYTTWTQQALSANGTVGGSSYACEAKSQEGSYNIYYAFDGDSSTYWGPGTSPTSGTPQWITYYSPTPIRTSAFSITFKDSGEIFTSGSIKGSTDNATWTTLAVFSGNSNTTLNLTTTDTGVYNYIRLEATGSGSGWGKVVQFSVTGEEEVTTHPDYFCTEVEWQSDLTNYGVCGKFVCDTTNNTVRLPDISGFIQGINDTTTLGNLGDVVEQVKATVSGDTTVVEPVSTKVLYYVVVAGSTKTDVQVDIDQISVDLAEKVDISSLIDASVVIESYNNGTSWYRIYSDGWCEQGGRGATGSGQTGSITLLKTMRDTNFSASITPNTAGQLTPALTGRAVGSLTVTLPEFISDWQVNGYIAAS